MTGPAEPADTPQSQPVKRQKRKHDCRKDILLVGDGNLSFSLALAKSQTSDQLKLTATTYEDLASLRAKYGESKIDSTIDELTQRGHDVIHGVDATKLHVTFKDRKFHEIHFMHPLVPSSDKKLLMDKSGRSSENLAVFANRRMLVKFLHAALPLVSDCIKITIKNVFPYTGWRLHRLATHVRGLKFLEQRISDHPPGYESRDLELDRPFALTNAETFVFAPGDADPNESLADAKKYCDVCEVKCSSVADMEKHKISRLHKKRQLLEDGWTVFLADEGLSSLCFCFV